jgi:hypothetical protein
MEPDTDPDSSIFVIDLAKWQQKTNFFCLFLVEGTLTSFLKDKSQKHTDPTDPDPHHRYVEYPVLELETAAA